MMGPTDWVWALIWISALLAMTWLVVGGTPRPRPTEDALAILRARFARGDISLDEFERAQAALLSEIGALNR